MKHLYIFTFIIASLLLSCDNEENIYVELENGKNFIDNNPEGEVQEYIYDFYKKYSRVILTNPDTTDYRYNFTSINKILLETPVNKNIYKEELTSEETTILMDGFDFLNEVFFDLYSDEFKKDFFPSSIQLADVIKKWDWGYDTITPLAYASRNFIAISGINKDLKSMTEAKKNEYKEKINTKFWYNHLLLGVEKLKIPDSFYAISKKYYGSDEPDSDWMGDIEKAHNRGFIKGTVWGMYIMDSEDIYSYIENIFKIDRTEFDELREKYPNIKLKYEILRETILKDFNFDISEINK